MARFYRKNKPTNSSELFIDGQGFEVRVKKLNVIGILDLSSLLLEMRSSNQSLDVTVYRRALEAVSELIVDIAGLVDDEEKPLTWADLSEADRLDLLSEVSLDSITNLLHQLVDHDRLSAPEKKT